MHLSPAGAGLSKTVGAMLAELSAPCQYNWSIHHPYHGGTRFGGATDPKQIDLQWPVWLYDHQQGLWRYLKQHPADWTPYIVADRSQAAVVASRLEQALRDLEASGSRTVVIGELLRLADSAANQRRNQSRLQMTGAQLLAHNAEEAFDEALEGITALLGRWFAVAGTNARQAALALVDAESAHHDSTGAEDSHA